MEHFGSILLVLVSLCLSLLPSVNSSAPSFTTSSGSVYNYEDPNSGPGYYQTAVEYYDSTEASPGSGHFLYMLARVYELNEDGDECCDSGGGSCPYNTGCNDHDMYVINNVFDTEEQSGAIESCTFTGNVEAPGDSQTASCDPKTSYGICVPFVFTSTLIINETSVAVGNQMFPLNKDSIHAHVLISAWPFISTSTGLRLKLLIMSEDVNLQAMVVEPSGVDVTQDSMNGPTQFNTFTGVTVQDVKNRQGALNISSYALINGTVAAKVNISGLYPHEYNLDARYIYIDMPRGTTVEYSVNIYLPDVSGVPTGVPPVTSNTKTISFIDKNKVYFIVAGCVLGAILIFICIVGVIKCL